MIMFYDAMLLVAVLFFASIPVAVAFQITTEHILYPLYILYIYLVAFVFFGWCWTHGGQTLGLKTWKIRLIADNGKKISWQAALLRYLGSIPLLAQLRHWFYLVLHQQGASGLERYNLQNPLKTRQRVNLNATSAHSRIRLTGRKATTTAGAW